MPATYEPIATTTLSSENTAITFTSIGNGYTDLRLVIVMTKSSSAATNCVLRFNNNTATNYSSTLIKGDGTSATSNRFTNGAYMNIWGGAVSVTNDVALLTVDIFSYANSTNKTVLATGSNDKNGSGDVHRNVGLWRNTSAITEINLFDTIGRNFGIGTTATLYGILKA